MMPGPRPEATADLPAGTEIDLTIVPERLIEQRGP
jgi:hypothetical protein